MKIGEIFCGKSLKEDLSIGTTFDPCYFSWDSPFKVVILRTENSTLYQILILFIEFYYFYHIFVFFFAKYLFSFTISSSVY